VSLVNPDNVKRGFVLVQAVSESGPYYLDASCPGLQTELLMFNTAGFNTAFFK